MGLLPKQREELHRAIYEYFVKMKFENTAQAFAAEVENVTL